MFAHWDYPPAFTGPGFLPSRLHPPVLSQPNFASDIRFAVMSDSLSRLTAEFVLWYCELRVVPKIAKRLIGFSRNLEWRLCQQTLFQDRTPQFPTIDNINVTAAQNRKVQGISSNKSLSMMPSIRYHWYGITGNDLSDDRPSTSRLRKPVKKNQQIIRAALNGHMNYLISQPSEESRHYSECCHVPVIMRTIRATIYQWSCEILDIKMNVSVISMYLWNVGQFVPDYKTQHPRRQVFTPVAVRTWNLTYLIPRPLEIWCHRPCCHLSVITEIIPAEIYEWLSNIQSYVGMPTSEPSPIRWCVFITGHT
jgi:hypothetical protein